MNYVIDSGPHIKDKDHTSSIMHKVMMALIPIVIFAIYKNGYIPYQKGYISFYEMFRPLLIIIVAMLTSFISEVLYIRLILGRKKQVLRQYIKHSYAMLPGLFLALIIPINTPLWLVSLGSVFATIIGKMFFGGFGHNIFNPALVGCLFISSSYGSLITSRGGYLNSFEDTISSATPLSHISSLNYVGNWHDVGSSFGSLWDYFFGFIPGAIGETSKILILIAMIYLIANKVIKWRIPIFYILTVFVMTFIIGAYNHMGLWFPAFEILSGGLMFGAVFMATDPVTSPVTRSGEFLYGIGLGLLTVLFRFLTPYPEGVLTSILTMNMLVFIIDRIGIVCKFNLRRLIIPSLILITLSIGMSFYIGYHIKPKPENVSNNFNIISVKDQNNSTIYRVSSKGIHSITADITIIDNKIDSINIISQEETYWQNILDNNYLDKLIAGQDNIDKVDTISGVTISSDALKLMVKETLKDYKNRR